MNRASVAIGAVMALLLAAGLAKAQPAPGIGVLHFISISGVLTQHNDNHRTGSNLAETELNIGNVNFARMKRIFRLDVDGQIVAQPLYAGGIFVNNSFRNVLYVATAANNLYAFDADNGQLIRYSMLHPLIECRPKDQPAYTRNPAYRIADAETPAIPRSAGGTTTPFLGIISTPVTGFSDAVRRIQDRYTTMRSSANGPSRSVPPTRARSRHAQG